MKREKAPSLSGYQLAGLAVLAILLASGIAAAGTFLVLRFTNRSAVPTADPELVREEVPIQPAVDVSMPSHVPQHFSEDVVIPGVTETGLDVLRQDDTDGRSPEGV